MEVDHSPTRQVTPRPNDRCRRCEHPYGEHTGDNLACTVEFGKAGRVPTTEFGGVCPCPAFVFEPATPDPEPEPELMDGPAMYAEALGYVRLARSARSGSSALHVEREALEKAAVYFAGASASVLGRLAIDNGTGDLEERRWVAALAGDDLPEALPPTTARKVSEGTTA